MDLQPYTFLKTGLSRLALAFLLLIYVNVHGQIVDQSSFEVYSNGTAFDDSQWNGEGFNTDWSDGFNSRSQIVTSEAHSGSKSLRVHYPQWQYGTNGTGGQAKLTLPSDDEYYLSYWVKFSPTFSWGNSSEGGKLPGLASDGLCSGGDNCNGYNGFTARFMWRDNGRAVLYLYHMDKPESFGEDIQLKHSDNSNVYFPKNQWIHIVERVKINSTTGSSANYDGEVQVWVNDEEVLDLNNLRFVRNSDQIDVLYFSTFHGGNNSSWAPTNNSSYTYFDDILVTTNQSDIWSSTDTDNDGVPDSIDGCPTDPNKTNPGLCGCFVTEGTCDDCNGEAGGTAYTDACGNCVGGNTGLPECVNGNLFEDQFDDMNSTLSGLNLPKYNQSETACEELSIEDVSSGSFDPLYYVFPSPIDVTSNSKITARIRSTEEVEVRLDFRDVNGASTNGPNGSISYMVSGDPLLWEVFEYNFSAAAFTDNSMDKTQIESVVFYIDPGTAGFNGTVYFDYLAVGDPTGQDTSTCIVGTGTVDCNGDAGGTAYVDNCSNCVGGNTGQIDCDAQNIYEEQFIDETANLNGTNLAKVSATETECQELRIENVSLGNYDPFYITFPTPLDVSGDPKVVARVRATDQVDLRFDLRDVNGVSTNGSNGRVTNAIIGDDSQWNEYTFDYPQAAFDDNSVDATQIERIAFMFDPGSPGFTGVIHIDFIAVGDPTGMNNSPCSPGGQLPDCQGVEGGSAYYDSCGVCVGGTTGKAACAQDCHGDWGGSASLDDCNICSGGNTGVLPNQDSDNDGTLDCDDQCPTDPDKTAPGTCGCGVDDADSDSDGTPDCNDLCPNDAGKTAPGRCGCGVSDVDSDADGTPDCNDLCPSDPNKIAPGSCGCGIADTDSDSDGTPDCDDLCPSDPNKTVEGTCGCGVADVDSDSDGTPDCNDQCPNDASKIVPGTCGCGVSDNDSDSDGTPDCNDLCPSDPNKITPGTCGCGEVETDTDSDGTPDCDDLCPADPNKTAPGACGCGVVDGTCEDCNGDPGGTAYTDVCGVCVGGNTGLTTTDTDADGTPDCNDLCPNDANKTSPGTCGCGVADTDSDFDGTPDCNDLCPSDPSKTAPGTCGCGVADTDTDSDGTPDCNDQCPNDVNKTEPGACGCGVTEGTCVDCNGDANGSAAIDLCGICAGGNTGITPDESCEDCNGDPNGTAAVDNCSVCSGGNTGIPVDECLTPIDSKVLAGVKVYPNPFESSLTIELDTDQSFDAKVYNSLGELVMTGASNNGKVGRVTIAGPAGVYFVQVITDDKSYMIPVVKE